MQREILFRGKREDNGEWVYGFYYTEADTTFILQHRKSLKTPSMSHSKQFICVDPETVGQYTGLKDSAGKKIFEGDILTVLDIHGKKYLDEVDYYASSFCLPGIGYPVGRFGRYGRNIIGNIHDTPELLNGK
jgi:uncharacterized phage protein (TIGR01671 family)